MISSCSDGMSDSFPFPVTTSGRLQHSGQRFWHLRCQTPNVSGQRRTVAPPSANFSSQSEGTLWVVLMHDSSPGAMEQNQKMFPRQLGTTLACYVKHRGEPRMNQTMRDTQRWIHAQKHLPCLIGSVTFSGLSCLPYLPDVMKREGGEEERQSHDVENKKYYWLFQNPDQNPPLWVTEKSKYCKISGESWCSNKEYLQ